MSKIRVTIIGIVCFIVGVLFTAIIIGKNDNRTVTESSDTALVYFGDNVITDYKIVSSNIFSGKKAVTELKTYIKQKTGVKLKSGFSAGNSKKTIRIKVDKHYTGEIIQIENGNIVIYGANAADCLENVCVFANMYLGFSFAGESREHLMKLGEINNPDTVMMLDDSWMKEREPIICLWKTNVPRGQYYNTGADLSSEILTYSDDQLYTYVKTMKACGFTGIQVTDMCSAWAQYSGYEFVHDRLRFMADAAHSLGMKFTLWVWGAEFDGYGWEDNSVVYYDYEHYDASYKSPEALATFNKYYDIYAELADCSDRVIMHFDDPSNIHSTIEVAYYAALFKDKVKAINPDIDFGVSDYTDKYNKEELAEVLGTDTTFYCGAATTDESNANFRVVTARTGAKLGVWSWNLCEMEIDQLAEMNVNARLIQDVYQRTALIGDEIYKPSYWSEMDSYHILSTFSLYVAGHLLQDNTLSAQEVLEEAAYAVVGDEYGEALFEILNIIQDARTGDSWQEFRKGFSEYLLESDDYPAESILERCEKFCPILDEMIEADIKGSTIPLAVPVSDMLHMIRSHLQQIKKFAEFRIDLEEIKMAYDAGESVETLNARLLEIAVPISNYDTLVGVWGQAEALAQYRLLWNITQVTDLEFPENPVYMYYLKQYVYQEICAYQKKSKDVYYASSAGGTLWGFALGDERAKVVADALVEDGLLLRTEDDRLYLANWEDYKFAY